MKFAILIVGSSLFLLTLPVSAGTFLETFDKFDLKDWEEVTERNLPTGEWRVVNGVLHAESKDDAIRMLVIKDAAWHDYEVELDVMPLDRQGRGHIVLAARVNQTYAIVFAIGNIFWNAPSPIVSGFIFKLNTGRRVGIPLVLMKIQDLFNGRPQGEIVDEILRVGVVTDICTTILPHPFLERGKWTQLKLRIVDKSFMFSVNEKLVLYLTCLFDSFAFLEEDLNVDSVGFGLAGYTARFDNLKITGEEVPNRGGLSVQPQGKLAVTWGQLKKYGK
ncbi:hypothetical protein C6503_01365 [Candidatus Poribacteria bacterium]|nr:MAG: hypothetical protein C6503_01365 [Candidatus Poribacteria bacterium]